MANFRRGSRIRDGCRSGARTRGFVDSVRRRRGVCGLAGCLRGLVAGDPNDTSVMIFLTHNMRTLDQLLKGIGLGVYDAIERFQKLASAY